jgi:RNA recognition motif-containing protein
MRLFVCNIGNSKTDADVRQLFEHFGTVTEATVVKDRQTGRSRGFAFVEMSNEQEASRAITELDGGPWSGRRLKLQAARPRPQSASHPHPPRPPALPPSKSTLFISGIGDANVHELWEIVEHHVGPVEDIRRGAGNFAFVDLRNAEDAERALTDKVCLMLNGEPLRISRARARRQFEGVCA